MLSSRGTQLRIPLYCLRMELSKSFKINLLTQHFVVENQASELWHLINPKLEETVPKQAVVDFLNDLAYIAIDLNLSKTKFQYLYFLEVL